jgi:hypothetical protein
MKAIVFCLEARLTYLRYFLNELEHKKNHV